MTSGREEIRLVHFREQEKWALHTDGGLIAEQRELWWGVRGWGIKRWEGQGEMPEAGDGFPCPL